MTSVNSEHSVSTYLQQLLHAFSSSASFSHPLEAYLHAKLILNEEKAYKNNPSLLYKTKVLEYIDLIKVWKNTHKS